MIGIKTKVKIVKKIFAVVEYVHCLGFICLYEKTHKPASLLHFFFKSEAVTYVT